MRANLFELDSLNAELKERLEASPELIGAFDRQLEMSWLHHENALDGVVLTEAELIQALEQQIIGDATQMATIASIRNHHAALAMVRSKAKGRRSRLDVPFLVELHERLVLGETHRKRGLWRADMPVHRTYTHEIAQPEEVQGELEKVSKSFFSVEFKEHHPIRQAAQAHWAFMRVFPFGDHNGRIGRLIQAFFLLRADYPLAIIHQVERQRYHDALRQPSSHLRRLLMEALQNSLANSLRLLDHLRDESQVRAG